MLDRSVLFNLYFNKGKSMQDIADILGCSLHKVSYWMGKHALLTRSRGDAMYLKHNPDGDPFLFGSPRTVQEAQLFGLGVCLYWGEGTKASPSSVRLGNTDPVLIEKFIEFLVKFFRIKRDDLRFGLQMFSDMRPTDAQYFPIGK